MGTGRRTMKVAVVGATGLIGRHLVASLVARGDEVVALSRHPGEVAGVPTTVWDPGHAGFPDDVRRRVDSIVNLAGTRIGPGRWTPQRRAQITESRLRTTRAVVVAIASGGPRVLCSASAVGVYGSTDRPVDESSPPGVGFLAELCTRWEHEATRAHGHARVVLLRSGVVLARDGGALPPLRRLAVLGLSGRVGTGHQWFSWIHLADEVASIVRCLTDDALEGPVNLVTDAVPQGDFARTLARHAHRPGGVPLPARLVRVVLGEAASLLLDGQRVVPARLREGRFLSSFPTLDDALADLV